MSPSWAYGAMWVCGLAFVCAVALLEFMRRMFVLKASSMLWMTALIAPWFCVLCYFAHLGASK